MNDLLLPLTWVTRSRVKRDPTHPRVRGSLADQLSPHGAHVLRFYRSHPAGWTLQFRIHSDATTQVLSASMAIEHIMALCNRLQQEIQEHQEQREKGDPK